MKRGREDVLMASVPGMSDLEPRDARSAYISRELQKAFADLEDSSQFQCAPI